jgi:hypothetical protein
MINTNQVVVARYEFDPFGRTLSISGPKVFGNRYRFSSKPTHELSGMYVNEKASGKRDPYLFIRNRAMTCS